MSRLIQIQQDILGTDSAASLRVGQILLFRVEGSIPYSAPLINTENIIFTKSITY